MTSTAVGQLPARWRTKASGLAPYSEAAARAFNEAADELERELEQDAGELLNLTQAAQVTGFNPETLGRKIRRGEIPNLGRPGAPRVRRADLPRKTPTIARRRHASYDVDADARALLAAGRAPK